jgi:hypothetical protein
MAFRAGKARRPAHGLKIFGAGMVIRENLLEFRETGREAARVHRNGYKLNFDFGKQPDKHGSNKPSEILTTCYANQKLLP